MESENEKEFEVIELSDFEMDNSFMTTELSI